MSDGNPKMTARRHSYKSRAWRGWDPGMRDPATSEENETIVRERNEALNMENKNG